MNFLFSTAALLLGPFIYAAGRRQPVAREVLDGFVLITVAGIVCVYIVPDAILRGGTGAIVSLVLGLLFPVAIERAFRRSHREAHVLIVVLAALALVVHAVIDGIALLPASQVSTTIAGVFGLKAGNELALGVILHRLPVGMAIWWSVRPSFGAPAALATFALVVLATGVAYFVGGDVVAWAETRGTAVFQAFVAGSLVHVVAFGVSHEHDGDRHSRAAGGSWGYRVGILLAMFLIFTVPRLH
jgi:zinc transporter ZupT